ncbi:DEKNAAC101322 [Brettanomyces naardenensis]|uniref:DEKNAAC101322 n=1 Tax=Brettanomyces naardenensis TaxID=13370 RepID=A0A448YHR9_BRENA|nr:DEKNAAC101322 [Brettanomyces naardenensis]
MARLTSSPISISLTQGSHHMLARQHADSNTSSFLDTYGQTNFSPASRTNRLNLRAESVALESDDEELSTTSSSAANSHLPQAPVSSSFGSVLDDATILKNVGKHLPADSEHSLQLQGGDITRDLYNIGTKVQQSLRRTRSLTGMDVLGERRGSSASQLRVPGGFRREFVVNKRTKFGYTLNQPSGLTRNFLEFLSIYGHFAGEDLEDEDFLACDYTSEDKQDEETPLLEEIEEERYLGRIRRQASKPSAKGKASTIKSFFLLFKSFVGTGVLFLPKAFSNGGLFLSIGLLVFFGILSYFCYLILVQTKVKTGVSSFGDIGDVLYGKQMKLLILSSIVLSQIGFVAAYTVFTAENFKAFLHNAFGLEAGISVLVFAEALFYIPMSLVRNITKLSLAALVANVFILSGICIIVYYASADLVSNGVADITVFSGEKWTLFIGVAIFAFEGIGLIIPVQESMQRPEDFPKVLLAVVVACSVLFIGIGALGYLTYGDDVKTVIILSLPQDSPYVISIQLFYPLAIMFSVPIQLLPAIRIMERRVFKKRSGKADQVTKWEKNIFRILIVCLTTLIAYYGSADLDQFVSFVGCFACIPLVYLYPPMLHLRSCAKSLVAKGLDLSIILLGFAALSYTTYQLIVG